MSYRILGCAVVLLLASVLTGCDGEATVLVPDREPAASPEPRPEPKPDTVGPASLTAEVEVSPTVVSVGQMVFLHVRVRNEGGTAALAVSPVTPVMKGVGKATLLDPPDPSTVAIPANEGHIYSYVYEAAEAGPVDFEVTVTGIDEKTEATLVAGPLAANLRIDGAPLLTVDALTLPPAGVVAEPFKVTMTVSNGGQSVAQKVAPSALNVMGTAAVQLVAGPTPVSADILGAGKATFEWTYKATSPGWVSFSGAAGGEDGNSGSTVSALEVTSAQMNIESKAALEATLLVPAQVATGTPFMATLLVRNLGTAVAIAVAPSQLISVPGAGSVTVSSSSPQAAVDIAGGGVAPFTFTVTATGTGTLSLSASATGTDAMSSASITTGVVLSSALSVVPKAALEVVSLTAPATVTRGQSFPVTLTVKNTGGSALENVLPSAAPLSPTTAGGAQAQSQSSITPQTLAPGATATFSWTFVEAGASSGALTFSTSAVAQDSVLKTQVMAPTPGIAVVNVVDPAALVATVSVPPLATLNSNFSVSMTVTNNGQSPAAMVAPSLTVSGTATAAVVSSPSTQNIAAGASVTFNWTYKATGAGALTFTGSAAGRDGNSNQAVVSPSVTSASVTVNSSATLVATLTAPSSVASGTSFTATMSVKNNGTALARSVRPSPLVPGVTNVNGSASASSTTSPMAVDIPGGGTATFTWTFNATGTGAMVLNGGATGTDSATNASIAAAAVSSQQIAVLNPASLTVTSLTAPASISLGQSFTVSMTVRNSGGTSATGVLPNPLLPTVTATGGAVATATSTPAAQNIAAGATATFSWTFVDQSESAGTFSFTAGAVGTDAAFNTQVTAAGISSAIVRVQTPPALSIQLNPPTTATVGAAFNLAIVIRNDGQAEARTVKPTTPLITGSATATLGAGPTPSSATIAPGGSATFIYAVTPTQAGTLTFSSGATFVDGNSLQADSVPAVSSAPLTVLTPAALTAALSIPSTVSSGQAFNAILVVRNTGGSAATGVLPSPLIPTVNSVSGGASASASFSPAPMDIPGGGTATFSWPFTASGSGAITLTGGATGKDGASGLTVNAAAVTSAQAQVVLPAALTVTSISAPATIVRGQSFTVTMTVMNGGGSALNNVLPSPNPVSVSATGGAAANTVSSATARNIAAGASATFSWTFTESGTGTGSLSFSAGARGTDAVSNALVTAPSVSSSMVNVAAPAQLSVTSVTAPGRISRGQLFDVVVTVKNVGGVSANNVKPTTLAVTATGGAAATTSTVPNGVTLPAGAEQTFTYAFLENGTGAGTLSFGAGASGVDAVSSASLTAAQSASAAMTVQTPASLSVTAISLPSTITRGTAFSVSMTVTNSGQATANAVLPTPSPLTRNATGGALASTTTTQTAVSIAGGSSQTFTWQYLENGTAAGTLSFTGGAAGQDANSGAAKTAAQVTSAVAQVVAPSSLRVTAITLPATIVRGQTFTVSMTVQNTGGVAVNSVLPSPNPLTVLAQGGAAATTTTTQTAKNIAAGASATYSWTYVENGTAAGGLSFTGGAVGTEAGTGATVRATAIQSTVASVIAPARIAIDSVAVPAKLSRGQAFDVVVTVRNTGGSDATSVRPTVTLSATGGAAATTASAPAAVTLAAGATASFTYAYTENGTGAGSLVFSATASGIDSATATAITASAVSSPSATVQTRAALTAVLSAPQNVSRGGAFTVSMTVTNSGQATALAVLPSALTVAITGGAAAGSSTAQSAVSLTSGQSHTFNWVYAESGTAAGTLTFSGSVSGKDENTQAVVSSPSASSGAVNVVAPARLVVTSLTAPATVARGQAFTVTLNVQNTGGSTAQGVLPSPTLPTVQAQGGANATSTTTATARDIAAGASNSFTFNFTESGTAPGSLTFTAGASGTDAVTGAMLSAAAVTSAAVNVVAAANLVVDPVSLPARISQGQTFSVSVTVRNTGGVAANAVSLSPAPPTVTATGGVALTTTSAPAAVNLAAGASTTFTYSYRESGSGAGTARLQLQAVGTDAVRNVQVSSATVQSSLLTVETPARLSISSFVAPVQLNRGATFAVTMTVFNTGQATATGVLPVPNPPTASVTGGVVVNTSSTVTAVSIPGNSSQTFTWTYVESGSAAGTLSFTGTARGTDGNSGVVQTTASATSNVSTVGNAVVCASGNAYVGLGGRSLDGARVDLAAGSDRIRPKPYSVLVPELGRVLGTTPSSINNRGATFDEAPDRWWLEPELGALSMYQLLRSSFQGCLTYTNSATAYSANPTTTTAQTNCLAFQRKFWSREPTAAETSACVNFAVSADNNDTNPRRRWAYVCSAVMTSVGFIAD